MARRRAAYRPTTGTVYDQVCRYVLHLEELPLLLWLLRLRAGTVEFVDWLDTRGVAWPGQPVRIRDTVAWMLDLHDGSRPWAVVGEWQGPPDGSMVGRLLGYSGGGGLPRPPHRPLR